MKKLSAIRRHIQSLLIVLSLALVAGCNTSPARSSSSGAPDITPAPATVSSPSTQAGIPSDAPGGVPSAPETDQSKTAEKTKPTSGSQESRSDDEILAEALEAFGKKNTTTRQRESTEPPLSQTGRGQTSTNAEKSENLNSELEDKFAKFDRLMLSERESVTRKDNRDGGGIPEGGLFADSESGEEVLETAMVDNTPPMSRKGEANIPTRDASPVPPDIAGIEDDDIIARQLREAAMKEQDLKLREKLWDEYRKYKREQR